MYPLSFEYSLRQALGQLVKVVYVQKILQDKQKIVSLL